MASRKQVLAAARKRYGKQAYLDVYKWPSSPAKREADRQAARDDDARRSETARLAKEHGKHTPALLKAARFVVDTDGDHTALESLRIALEASEREEQLRLDAADASKAYYDNKRHRNPHYFQYRIAVAMGGPIPMCTIECEADTLAELLDKLNSDTKQTRFVAGKVK